MWSRNIIFIAYIKKKILNKKERKEKKRFWRNIKASITITSIQFKISQEYKYNIINKNLKNLKNINITS
jgi:guanylate kinase